MVQHFLGPFVPVGTLTCCAVLIEVERCFLSVVHFFNGLSSSTILCGVVWGAVGPEVVQLCRCATDAHVQLYGTLCGALTNGHCGEAMIL